MRTFVLIAFIAFVFVAASLAQGLYRYTVRDSGVAAVFVNDSEIVEVGGGAITSPSENTVQTGSDSSNNTNDDNDSNSSNTTSQNENNDFVVTFSDEEAESNSAQDPVVAQVEVQVSDSSDSSGASDESTGNTTTVNTEEIIAALIGNQAVVTTTSGASGSAGGSFFGNNSGGTFHIYASRVRDAFRARRVTNLTIPSGSEILRNNARDGRVFTQSDFSLFVASTILQDDNIEDISIAQGVMTTEYRAFGQLFGFVPMRYTLRVSLSFSAGGVSDIDVKFPWYKFFLKTGTTKKLLESNLRDEIAVYVQEQHTEFDIATRAFTAVAETLRARVGV